MKYACVYCGKELPEQHSACCGEVGHTETLEESEKRWNELAMPEELDAYLENLAERHDYER